MTWGVTVFALVWPAAFVWFCRRHWYLKGIERGIQSTLALAVRIGGPGLGMAIALEGAKPPQSPGKAVN